MPPYRSPGFRRHAALGQRRRYLFESRTQGSKVAGLAHLLMYSELSCILPAVRVHVERLNKALDEANQQGWVVVDMKRDWKTIFPFDEKNKRIPPASD